MDLLYLSARVNSCVRLGKQTDIGHPGGMGNMKSSPQPLPLAAGWFTFKVTSLMLILWLIDWVGRPGRTIRKNRAQPGECFMTESKIFSVHSDQTEPIILVFCSVFGIIEGGVCDFNYDFDRREKGRQSTLADSNLSLLHALTFHSHMLS